MMGSGRYCNIVQTSEAVWGCLFRMFAIPWTENKYAKVHQHLEPLQYWLLGVVDPHACVVKILEAVSRFRVQDYL